MSSPNKYMMYTDGCTQSFDVRFVDLADAREGSPQGGSIILVNTLLYQVWSLVFKLLEGSDVLTSLLGTSTRSTRTGH